MHDGGRPIWARWLTPAAGGFGMVACTVFLALCLAPASRGDSLDTEPAPAELDKSPTREIVKKKPATPAPAAEPAPADKRVPTLEPATEPDPDRKPPPAPAPASKPARAPKPEPTSEPAPAPEPAPASEPGPVSEPPSLPAQSQLEAPTGQLVPNAAWPRDWKDGWLNVTANLRANSCHWVERIEKDGSARIVGIVPEEAERRKLEASLKASGDAADVSVEIEPRSSSICKLATVLAGRALPAPQRMLRLDPDVERLVDGDKFKIIIDAPDVDSMISVHYLDAGGTVHTLFPSDYQTFALVGPEEQLAVLAFDDLDFWEVSPPLGREAILLLAQPDDLVLPLYEGSEPLDTFLARLEAALGSPVEFVKPLASLLVLETSGK